LKEHCQEFNPKVLVADGAEVIMNGFRNVFGEDFVRVYCWFHVMKKLKEALTQVASQTKSEVLDDIRLL